MGLESESLECEGESSTVWMSLVCMFWNLQLLVLYETDIKLACRKSDFSYVFVFKY